MATGAICHQGTAMIAVRMPPGATSIFARAASPLRTNCDWLKDPSARVRIGDIAVGKRPCPHLHLHPTLNP
jgi:hypothetical protein